jgi:hypothetical protein
LWVSSICSLTVTGRPEHSFFLGTEPVMATEIITGFVMIVGNWSS